MSVFKKLKGTFQNAQQDIVDGLRALATLDTQPRLEHLRNIKSRDISLDAGADLLHRYQKVWASIQTDTKESAKKAEEVSTLLLPMFKVWDKSSESVARLEEEVKAIPSILTTLDQLHTLLGSLRQDFAAAEKGLEMLENLCEEQEQQTRHQDELQKLAMYRAQKVAEAERVKVELAHQHAKKIADRELAKRQNLQERAAAFTSAFQEDLNYYRAHGHPDRIPTEFPKVSSLSEIEIDEDKQALDSFLGPEGEGESAPGNLEISGEGAYIEDDYITGFSVKQDVEFIEDIDYISSTMISSLDEGNNDQDQEDGQATKQNLSEPETSEAQGRKSDKDATQEEGKTDQADAPANSKSENYSDTKNRNKDKKAESVEVGGVKGDDREGESKVSKDSGIDEVGASPS